jgi:copper chaperone
MTLVKKKFKIVDMDCTSCAVSIDWDLEDIEGVQSSKTNYAKGITEVELDPTKTKVDLVLKTIKKSGYTAVLFE